MMFTVSYLTLSVNYVPYNIACLQCKLPCMLTTIWPILLAHLKQAGFIHVMYLCQYVTCLHSVYEPRPNWDSVIKYLKLHNVIKTQEAKVTFCTWKKLWTEWLCNMAPVYTEDCEGCWSSSLFLGSSFKMKRCRKSVQLGAKFLARNIITRTNRCQTKILQEDNHR